MTIRETLSTAFDMMEHYGEEASLMAVHQADKLLKKGDEPGFHAWVEISTAICGLENQALEPKSRFH